MTERSETEILADLIRLLTRIEPNGGLATAADAELIEQARAALHRYVVAAGKGDLASMARPRKLSDTPIWFFSLVIATGFSVGALVYGSPQLPLLVVAPCGAAFLMLIMLIADWRKP